MEKEQYVGKAAIKQEPRKPFKFKLGEKCVQHKHLSDAIANEIQGLHDTDTSLQGQIDSVNTDLSELHKKAEKLGVYLGVNPNNEQIEINGRSGNFDLTYTGAVRLETFGDAGYEVIDIAENKQGSSLNIYTSESTILPYFQWEGGPTTYTRTGGYGTQKAVFTFSYGGVTKSVEAKTKFVLRKYIGFFDFDTAPQDVMNSGIIDIYSDLADSEWRDNNFQVQLPKSEGLFLEPYKYIYLFVPTYVQAVKLLQPDALDAPIELVSDGIRYRSVGGVNYSYNVYRSTLKISVNTPKKLTIVMTIL